MNARLAVAIGLVSLVFVAGVGQSVATHDDGDGISSMLADASEAVSGGEDGAVTAADPATETPGDGADAASKDSSDDAGSGTDGHDAGSGDAGSADDGNGATATETDGDAATRTGPPFAFTVDGIEDCGNTCRDVTATLRNRQTAAATDVTVETAIYAGNETNGGARVWTGSESVGRIGPGAAHTSTERVKLGWIAAGKVKSAGGWITVETTVETADRSWTVERHRDVL